MTWRWVISLVTLPLVVAAMTLPPNKFIKDFTRFHQLNNVIAHSTTETFLTDSESRHW